MKNKRNLIIIVIAIGAIMSFLFFILQRRANFPLREELAQLRGEKQKEENFARHLEELGGKSAQLDKDEEALYKVIPLGEAQPLNLIRELIQLGSELGLDRVNFSAQPISKELKPKEAKTEPKRSVLQMSFEADFQQLIKFLERISKLKRLVFPKTIHIERSEEILPRQKITLQLTAYYF